MAAIKLVPQAAKDYLNLDRAVRIEVRAAFERLKVDPRGYGDPLGNKCGIDLFGFFSIRAGKRIRVIYSVGDADEVIVRVIGRREAFEAHRTAQARIRAFMDAAVSELKELGDVLKAAGD